MGCVVRWVGVCWHGAQSHANRINAQAKTHITKYHNFHDEVDYYRVHWWKCQGVRAGLAVAPLLLLPLSDA